MVSESGRCDDIPEVVLFPVGAAPVCTGDSSEGVDSKPTAVEGAAVAHGVGGVDWELVSCEVGEDVGGGPGADGARCVVCRVSEAVLYE